MAIINEAKVKSMMVRVTHAHYVKSDILDEFGELECACGEIFREQGNGINPRVTHADHVAMRLLDGFEKIEKQYV